MVLSWLDSVTLIGWVKVVSGGSKASQISGFSMSGMIFVEGVWVFSVLVVEFLLVKGCLTSITRFLL